MPGLFTRYQQHGWALVPLAPGQKSPRDKGWNREALCLTSEDDVRNLTHAGLAHAYSGTCAIDIDDVELAIEAMGKVGIDLREYLFASDAVRISSGRPNRAKLLYRLETPLPSYKVISLRDGVKVNVIDFRCATKGGMSVQDALPPTLHPDTKKPYVWRYNDAMIGDWQSLPDLPAPLRAYWESKLKPADAEKEAIDYDYTEAELIALCKPFDPDTDYLTWINVGMALHHASGGSDAGFAAWNEWSKQGDKYKGEHDLDVHWRSFNGSGITVDYLLSHQTASPDDFDDLPPSDDPVTQIKQISADRFLPVRVGEWVKRPPPKWIIDGLLPQADLALVYGGSGVGKSFWVLDLAMAIALGNSWHDREVVKGPVLWIAAEAAGSVRNRALAYAKQHDVDLAATDLWIVGDTPSLDDIEHVRALAKHAKPIAPSIIVVDTLAAASGGANENSGEDMGAILAACRALHRITGALVVLIHHAGKDAAKGARGWSGLRAAMQTEIEVSQDPAGFRKARITKQRDAEQNLEFAFKLSPVALEPFDNRPQVSCVVEPAESIATLDVVPHAGLIAAGLEMFFAGGTTEIDKGALERAVHRAAVAAHDASVEINAEAEAVPQLMVYSGQAAYLENSITLLKLPGMRKGGDLL